MNTTETENVSTPPIPPKIRFYWFHSQHHAVKAALIGLAGTLVLVAGGGIGVLYNSNSMASKLQSDMSDLSKRYEGALGTINDKDKIIGAKDVEIQRLETQLAPFRVIAIEKYTGSESQALNQLATQINLLAELDKQKSDTILQLQEQVIRAEQLASPPTLTLGSHTTEIVGTNHVVHIVLNPSKYTGLGILSFSVSIQTEDDAKIIDFWPEGSIDYRYADDSKRIAPDGRSAFLYYSVVGNTTHPRFQITVTGPCKLQLVGTHDLQPITIEVN